MTARMKTENNFVIESSTAAYELAKKKNIEISPFHKNSYDNKLS